MIVYCVIGGSCDSEYEFVAGIFTSDEAAQKAIEYFKEKAREEDDYRADEDTAYYGIQKHHLANDINEFLKWEA